VRAARSARNHTLTRAFTLPNRRFRITFLGVEIHRSARKHGYADQDIRHAATHHLAAYQLDDDDDGPQRELRLGPDQAGNLLEIVVLLLDDDRELIIHAMRMRPKYRDLLL
jgi:hypothetical protein